MAQRGDRLTIVPLREDEGPERLAIEREASTEEEQEGEPLKDRVERLETQMALLLDELEEFEQRLEEAAQQRL